MRQSTPLTFVSAAEIALLNIKRRIAANRAAERAAEDAAMARLLAAAQTFPNTMDGDFGRVRITEGVRS